MHHIAHFLQAHCEQPFVIGPDSESEQWVYSIATPYQRDYAIALKQKFGDKEVAMSLPERGTQDRNIVIVDVMLPVRSKMLLPVAKN
jgi:ribose-phosphate pyrophosphokinase